MAKIEAHRECPICNKEFSVTVEFDKFQAWQRGDMHIQDAFPELTPDQRELFLTGYCRDCWKNIFSGEEE